MKSLWITLPLLLAACASAPPAQPIDLVGTWVHTNRGCTETYVYRADGTFSVSSDEERLEGRYVAEPPATGDTSLKMVRVVETDNGKFDCSKTSWNHTGSRDTRYLVFSTDKQSFKVCFKAAGERCFGPVHRQ